MRTITAAQNRFIKSFLSNKNFALLPDGKLPQVKKFHGSGTSLIELFNLGIDAADGTGEASNRVFDTEGAAAT